MQQRSIYSFVWSYDPDFFRGMVRERYKVDVPTLQREVSRLKAQVRQRDDWRNKQARIADDYRRRYEEMRSRYFRLQDEYGRAVRELREERARDRPGYRR